MSEALARAWRSRAHGEAKVGRAFARIGEACQADAEVPGFVRDALRAASLEEARHGELCAELACAYGDARPIDLAGAAADDEPLPLATAAERGLLIVSACCVSESIASAYLERCYVTATAPRARAALHALLRDEIGHAQLGWAYLAALPRRSPVRRVIEASVPGIVTRARLAWRERIAALHPIAAPEHGYPESEACGAVVDEACEALVLRGFRHVGLRL